MKLLELIFLAISVSLDAFAVSICKGLNSKNKLKTATICSIWFSTFQVLMPLIGYFLGTFLLQYIEPFDHWIVFIVLLILGINMIKESFNKEQDNLNSNLGIKTMFSLSFATSIDALAVGITLVITNSKLFLSLLLIFFVTFFMCFAGSIAGNKLGEKNQKTSSIIGGLILIVLGIKIVIEHLFFS